MKVLLLSLLVLSFLMGSQAFACPIFQGTYICSVDSQKIISFSVEQSTNSTGVTSYRLYTATEHMDYVTDGQLNHVIPNTIFSFAQTYISICEADSLSIQELVPDFGYVRVNSSMKADKLLHIVFNFDKVLHGTQPPASIELICTPNSF